MPYFLDIDELLVSDRTWVSLMVSLLLVGTLGFPPMGVGGECSFKMLWQVSLGPGREASCNNVISLVITCGNMLVITLDGSVLCGGTPW